MKVINLGDSNSVIGNIIAQMRDRNVQKDSLRFRSNLKKLGNIFAYELSKTLDYHPKDITTPLATARVNISDSKIVAATILRAGLPLHEGILEIFDKAENAFIAAYRKYDKGDDFHVNIEYCTCPSLAGKVLILADTMLATGASLEVSYRRLLDDGGEPAYTHFVCPISSIYAIEYIQKRFPDNTTLWTAAVDEELTSHSYIVPGLGDAGDLSFGPKL
ncbi:MAG: uracil phosphoribosyltransferase [Bacteroidales bacterium]|jgi:uracil phosphoribosyltransferase|nr:uracil phosphoribosyltransferase [Bacteroidales bacterium]MEE3389641.1 uracil phosphoribosyltransferase [Candidatus Cryptobacteroides sp.]MCI2108387.1 uracil phosphoribosyltransferase [Bacteroidales bacterium]MCI2133809.1 uracil phosphoribosyltransferase [Bacteroidales bacterium]MCI2135680.1 uracil phosphoribosyltransferase [Bacteroidales bacterium]